MTISYAVTVWNEVEEIKRLLSFLLKNKRDEDEVIVRMDDSGPNEIWKYLVSLSGTPGYIYGKGPFNKGRGQGKDYSAFCVIDITNPPYKVVARFRNNIISPMVYPTVVKRLAEQYNNAFCLIEINDIGGQVADVLYSDLEYENVLMCSHQGRKGQTISGGFGKGTVQFGVRTSQVVKKLGCSVLKSLIEEDKLLVEDQEIVGELTTFVAKKQSYEADDGHHDDLVMCLVLFGWLTRQEYFKNLTDVDVRTDIYKEDIEQLEEDMSPFGFISDAGGEDSVWDGKDRWYSDQNTNDSGLF